MQPRRGETAGRINVERNRFNELAGEYNIKIKQIPTNLVASIANFDPVPLFKSDAGAEDAPEVEFDFD